ncbi:MAG: hypothetical protein PVJ85_05530 [Anaerolineae bacterium]|jgi:hypothetical protein
MLDALKRLLSPEYLAVAEPGPLGGLWVLYVALGVLFVAGLLIAFWILVGPRRRQQPSARRALAWYELWVCLVGLLTIVGRFLSWPGWSARIWPYSLALLSLVGILAYAFRHMPLSATVRVQLDILAFNPPARAAQGRETSVDLQPARPAVEILLAVLHLLGLGLVLTGRFGWPLWTAPLAFLALLLPQSLLLWRKRQWPVLLTLTPLFGAYATTALWLLYHGWGITVIPWQGLAFPNPLLSLLYVDGIVLAATIYAILCQLYVISYLLEERAAFWRWTVAMLLILTLTWAGVVYFGKRTHGATASDPYAYAQMGVDLAERGTFLHRFSLFETVIPLDIAWAPLQPVGYHIPRNDLGDCPSVWATGASVLLAGGYLLFGETGLYITTPLVALLGVAATWLLVQETLRAEPKAVRYITGALAAALLATSPEYVDRLLVPMADAPAQLFTVLVLLFALRGMRQLGDGQRGRLSFLLAGVFFAWAYWVRHTQLVLALPVIVAVVLGIRGRYLGRGGAAADKRFWGAAVAPLLLFFAAALVAAFPDILYRWRVFGGPLATETTELPLMGLEHIGPVAIQMVRDALVAGEWGYLLPLALYGAYQLARRHPRPSLVLGSAFAAVLLVHLSYHSLRLRDLISLFPFVDLAVAYGAVRLVQSARRLVRGQTSRLGAGLLPAVVVAWVLLSLALSRWAMIDNLWRPGWASFGYMRPEHRAAFDRLADLTPPEAVIGASLNAGAVTLYAARDAIRPYDSWTEGEWTVFLEAMRARGRPVYLLDDGGLMAGFIKTEQALRTLVPVAELEIPLFNTRDRETGWLFRLEWQP